MFHQVSSQPITHVTLSNPNQSIIKLNFTHSVLNCKVPEVRVDLFSSIADIKVKRPFKTLYSLFF